MFCIGNVSDEKRKLVQVVKECVELGLEQVKPWGFWAILSQAVYDHAVANGYQVVRNIGGHGVGLEFHEDPWVGYIYKKGTQMVMAPGMMFTIDRWSIWVRIRSVWTRKTVGQFIPMIKSLQLSGRSRFLSQKMDMRSLLINDGSDAECCGF